MGSIDQNVSRTTEEVEELACLYSMKLHPAAIELDLFEIIAAAGPGAQLSPAEVASKLPTTNPEAHVMLDRIFRQLASYSILTCSVVEGEDGKAKRLYGLAPVGKFLTKNEDEVSMAPLVLMNLDKVHMESWSLFVLTGRSSRKATTASGLGAAASRGGGGEIIPKVLNPAFDKAHGMTSFEYHNSDPRFNKLFSDAMNTPTLFIMKKLLGNYKGFEGLNTLVDVGGSSGRSLKMIVSEHPSIRGINFDLPHVIEAAPPIKGVEHVGGDMFESVPSGDAIFMKFQGGKERTEGEYEALAKEAGFTGFKKACWALGNCIMEFHK
ncbi:Caffeic acid 3-O-methyltransferase [Acorus calamus]|uniref:Caffeic acid 3-O-methyltransferase n=1 Tax=Acorus calamus TaxID=4465 RepID=A0AAV9DTR6_ACOCL|nr:Caffeic acid 3-O-methyltransferase [Acorus calamus]